MLSSLKVYCYSTCVYTDFIILKKTIIMNKVVSYKMISQLAADKFSEIIIEHLNNGWELYGYPFARPHGTDASFFCQALVRYDSAKKSNLPTSVPR